MITSQYARQLDAFAEARAAGNLHCLTLEDLRDDPGATLDAIYTFLDLEPGSRELQQSNAAGTHTKVNEGWKRVTSIPFVTTLARLMPGGLRQAIRGKFRKSKLVAEGRFALTDDEEAAMTQLLASDLARLRDDYGINTAKAWGIDPTS